MKKIFLGFLLLICALPLTGCTKGETFGMFTHNGYALTTFKNKDLTYSQATEIVVLNSSASKSGASTMSLTDEEVSALTQKFSSVTVNVKYWDSTTDKSDTRTSIINGTQLKEMLIVNELKISNGILVKNIYMNDSILNDLEVLNIDFDNEIVPFKSLYSYHKDQDDQLVIRSNDFTEITADVTGGIFSNFIQQNESLYSNNNLISKFQSSFGMKFETLGGTQLHGTVLEVEFIWELKI